MSKIPVLEIALTNIDFINALLFQKILNASLKLSYNSRTPVGLVVKKAFKPVTKIWILLKIIFE